MYLFSSLASIYGTLEGRWIYTFHHLCHSNGSVRIIVIYTYVYIKIDWLYQSNQYCITLSVTDRFFNNYLCDLLIYHLFNLLVCHLLICSYIIYRFARISSTNSLVYHLLICSYAIHWLNRMSSSGMLYALSIAFERTWGHTFTIPICSIRWRLLLIPSLSIKNRLIISVDSMPYHLSK